MFICLPGNEEPVCIKQYYLRLAATDTQTPGGASNLLKDRVENPPTWASLRSLLGDRAPGSDMTVRTVERNQDCGTRHMCHLESANPGFGN